MSLRELATASDVCTPADDGAGPSNALSSFTNTLLGRSTKHQERLREVTFCFTVCLLSAKVRTSAVPAHGYIPAIH